MLLFSEKYTIIKKILTAFGINAKMYSAVLQSYEVVFLTDFESSLKQEKMSPTKPLSIT
jgi:hypothetical protein